MVRPSLLFAVFFSSSLALGAGSVARAASARAMLKKVDKANNPFRDRIFTMKMEIKEADGSTRQVEARVGERGFGKQRLVLYKAPADVKGMGVLVQSRNELYTYLPTYNKVRRVAMHARKQTFMGSDFTLDDSAQLNYSPDYRPTLLGEADGKIRLELLPRKGKDLAYSKIILTVDSSTWLIEKLEYFDDGKLLKTETRSQVKMFKGKPMQMYIQMVDNRTNHSTTVEVIDVEADIGLSKRKFSKRGLIRADL